MKQTRISIVFGTRPEAIKLAPVILALRRCGHVRCHVCVTGQHREMLDQVLTAFEIVPDVDLNVMMPDQSLAGLSARLIEQLDEYMKTYHPNLVLVQGDTTTTLCASLAAYYNHVPVGHVEAGLRTKNLQSPWPEEANRTLTSHLANLHFAPTELNRSNLIDEGIDPKSIVVTGNTVIDALLLASRKVELSKPSTLDLPPELRAENSSHRLVLITGHRRENFGPGLNAICHAIRQLALDFKDTHFVYPVHLNPNVQAPVKEILINNHLPNVHLLGPLAYLPFVALLRRATLILTDSGGIQEEAPTLGKPVLVMRDTTERPEAVAAGTARLVGTEKNVIVSETARLLNDSKAYEQIARVRNPYGDGKAAARIVDRCLQFIG